MSPTQKRTLDITQIIGWAAIASAAGRLIHRSVTIRSAQRYAAAGCACRMVVEHRRDHRVWISPEALALWSAAWLRAEA